MQDTIKQSFALFFVAGLAFFFFLLLMLLGSWNSGIQFCVFIQFMNDNYRVKRIAVEINV